MGGRLAKKLKREEHCQHMLPLDKPSMVDWRIHNLIIQPQEYIHVSPLTLRVYVTWALN